MDQAIGPLPPLDPELVAPLETLRSRMPAEITPEIIPALRQPFDPGELLAKHGIGREDVEIDGGQGARITLSILRPHGRAGTGPAIYHTHGGGMIAGNRFTAIEEVLVWTKRCDAVCVTVEYRLAPESPHPGPVEDCHAGLAWLAANAASLSVDPGRLCIAGGSAGGGLAAATALLARDRGGPPLAALLVMSPMLDDRDATVSTRQMETGHWNRTSNRTGWNALLGDRRGTADVPAYAAPARAADLSRLPPTYLDVGSAELLRDETVAYAARLWAAGNDAELHVWPGGFHGFTFFVPESELARRAMRTRLEWLERRLARGPI